MNNYTPLPEVTQLLKDKTLVMLVGPTAIGKSSLMNKVVEQESELVRVSGLTTREPRSNDEPWLYRYLDESEANELIENRLLVQYAVFPTTGKLYGTAADDYPGHYNLKDTQAGAVDSFRKLPFERHIVVSMAAPAEQWKQWLFMRYPDDSDERRKRLEEARQSIEWSLTQTSSDHHWLLNHSGGLDEAAHQLVEIVKQKVTDSDMPSEAFEMLGIIKTLLSYQ